MEAYREIDKCRLCGNPHLIPILSLGTMSLTGVFPKSKKQKVTSGPVDIIKCDETDGTDSCGLVQLKQSYRPEEMYAQDYGYRSGLNPSMTRHLQDTVERLLTKVQPASGDLIIDIGSNDSTLLQAYPRNKGLTLIGVDPIGEHLRKYYPPHIGLIPNYFSAATVEKHLGGKKAKIITSIAMFYDLEVPLDFVRDVRDTLADDGIWVFEQSYLPTMLEMNAYDTICHEHLEYYGLKQIAWIADRSNLKIIDVELNDTNGGSFRVTAAKAGSPHKENRPALDRLLAAEASLSDPKTLTSFRDRVHRHRQEILDFFKKAKKEKKKVFGYGASTKGNVILQFCGLTGKDLPCIGEINPNKFGCYTPGTYIPIVSEAEAKGGRPDYLMVLPWHFKDFILKKESDYLKSGGKLFFPLPAPTVH